MFSIRYGEDSTVIERDGKEFHRVDRDDCPSIATTDLLKKMNDLLPEPEDIEEE